MVLKLYIRAKNTTFFFSERYRFFLKTDGQRLCGNNICVPCAPNKWHGLLLYIKSWLGAGADHKKKSWDTINLNRLKSLYTTCYIQDRSPELWHIHRISIKRRCLRFQTLGIYLTYVWMNICAFILCMFPTSTYYQTFGPSFCDGHKNSAEPAMMRMRIFTGYSVSTPVAIALRSVFLVQRPCWTLFLVRPYLTQ